jgi:carbonic anhydrase
VHHTDCGGTHFTPEGFLETFKEEFEQDITDLSLPAGQERDIAASRDRHS